MKECLFDIIEWEPPLPRLRYYDFDDKAMDNPMSVMDINMVMTQVMSQCKFEADCFNDLSD